MLQGMGISTGYVAWIKRWRVDFSALLMIAFVFQLVWPIVVFTVPNFSNEHETALRNSICQVAVETAKQSPTEESLDGFVCECCVTRHASFDVFDLSVALIQYSHKNLISAIRPFIENEIGPIFFVTITSGPRDPPVL